MICYRKMGLSIFFTACIAGRVLSFTANDSIGTTIKNGQTVIIYEAGPKETVYSIARKYNLPPKSIIAINPELQTTGLKAGQQIYIPLETARTQTELTDEELKYAVYHTVEKGQTLYTVAKLYKVTQEDIKKWNAMTTPYLKVGSKIIVGVNKDATTAATEPTATEPASKSKILSDTGYEKIMEKGMAEWFDTPNGQTFNYALHKTVPIGQIVKIRANGVTVYAKIIGKLPADAPSNVVLRLSDMGFKKLESNQKKMQVEIEYVP